VLVKSKLLQHRKFKVAKPLLNRLAAFILICLIYSGAIGPRIISGGILYKDHFGFYGGLGKSLLFALVAFGLLAYRKKIVATNKWRYINILWLTLSVICYLIAWVMINKLLEGNRELIVIIYSQLLIWLSLIFALIGTFGFYTLKEIIAFYRKELIYALVLAILFYGLLTFVYGLWRILAGVVLHNVKWLLNLTGIKSFIILPRTLVLNKFGINIAQYCSGIESIALFSGLYILVGILDWNKFNHKKFLMIASPALIILFGFNILRVYVLILAGYFINPQIAFSLFHTYAGMVFFIIYSTLFWGVTYRWMINNSNA
jgi:exosortase/archaeosortase family protein